MRRFICIAYIILFIFILCACSNIFKIHEIVPDVTNNTDTESIFSCEFVDVQTAKAKLKSAVWGSDGWSIWFPEQSAYIYAKANHHMLRYNILDNTIDRAVKLESIPKALIEMTWNFTPDGKYAIAFNSWDENYDYMPRDIFLLDFENSKVTYLAHLIKDLKIQDIPENLQAEFDMENLRWINSDSSSNLSKLNYTLEVEYKERIGYVTYVKGANLPKQEIIILRNTLIDNEVPCVGIETGIIGSLVPVDPDNNALLGYYKFVLIDVVENKIIQECPINIK